MARANHARSSGVHLGQLIDGQRVAGLGSQVEILDGRLVVTPNTQSS